HLRSSQERRRKSRIAPYPALSGHFLFSCCSPGFVIIGWVILVLFTPARVPYPIKPPDDKPRTGCLGIIGLFRRVFTREWRHQEAEALLRPRMEVMEKPLKDRFAGAAS